MIEAKVICDSVNAQGDRLTTFKLRYPKFIHGEMMTHRVFSRNASSSRAIPTAKLLEEVRSDALRAAPVFWGKNQPGMQAAEELSDEADHNEISDRTWANLRWRDAALAAAEIAEDMLELGVHKQIVNRLLEPFSHINVVCTATEYANFFGLRLDKAAQPEMRALALAMWREYEGSDATLRKPGEWHLPFLDQFDDERAYRRSCSSASPEKVDRDHMIDLCRKVSTARCARVSYTTHEDPTRKPTFEEDLALYDRLLGAQPLHASPAEHQATPDWPTEDANYPWQYKSQHGNFVGWRQHRKMIAGEAVAPMPKEMTP